MFGRVRLYSSTNAGAGAGRTAREMPLVEVFLRTDFTVSWLKRWDVYPELAFLLLLFLGGPCFS